MMHFFNFFRWRKNLPPKPEDPPKSPVKPLPDPYGCQEALDEFDRQTAGFKPTVKPLVEAKPILSQEEFQQAFSPAVIRGAMGKLFTSGNRAGYGSATGELYFSNADDCWYFISDSGNIATVTDSGLLYPTSSTAEGADVVTKALVQKHGIVGGKIAYGESACADGLIPMPTAGSVSARLCDVRRMEFTDPDDIISATAPDNLPDGICYMNDARNLRFRVTYGSGKDRVTKNCATLHDAITTREAFEIAAKKWRAG